ncbi:MAG: flavin monoamine oxidase family protein [Alphaproteobacteria bacterium]
MNGGGKSNLIGRRNFLTLSSTTALAIGLLPITANSASASFDTIIIGAGIAGLAAARTLADAGASVLILEATRNIGGRIQTDWGLGAPFEVGAGWIHGPKGNPLSDLVKTANGRTFVTDDDNFAVFSSSGAALDYHDIAASDAALQQLYGQIDDTFDTDLSLQEAIHRVSPAAANDPTLAWMNSAYTEFDTGGPLDDLSALYFDEDDAFDGADVVLLTGYGGILDQLADNLDIRLNHPVTSIDYTEPDAVVVQSNGTDFTAQTVICTCPLGVLKSNGIRFTPALPDTHSRLISRIKMGNVTKAALKFDHAFWPTDIQYFGLMTQQQGRWNYFLNYRTFSDENILLGLSVGAYAKQIEQQGDPAMVADALQAIRSMFGKDTPQPTDYRLTRWSQNPYSLGAYSYANLGAKPQDFDDLAEPIADRIFLAGEHTTFAYHGTAHGAYLSGLTAAEIALEQLS